LIVHWWGENFDPILLNRTVWYKVSIWWDILFFGPYYLFAIYAFINGKEWIRSVTLIYCSVLTTIMTFIMGEQVFGEVVQKNYPVLLG
jgi:hypothetical protein